MKLMALRNYIFMLKNRKFQLLVGITLILFAFYAYPASAIVQVSSSLSTTTIQCQNNSEVSTSSAIYVNVKYCQLPQNVTGIIKIAYQMQPANGGDTAFGQNYVDNTIIGYENSTIVVYSWFNQTVTVTNTDMIELRGKITGITAQYKNYQIFYENSSDEVLTFGGGSGYDLTQYGIFDNTTVDKGDSQLLYGLWADNFNDNTQRFNITKGDQGWIVSNGKLWHQAVTTSNYITFNNTNFTNGSFLMIPNLIFANSTSVFGLTTRGDEGGRNFYLYRDQWALAGMRLYAYLNSGYNLLNLTLGVGSAPTGTDFYLNTFTNGTIHKVKYWNGTSSESDWQSIGINNSLTYGNIGLESHIMNASYDNAWFRAVDINGNLITQGNYTLDLDLENVTGGRTGDRLATINLTGTSFGGNVSVYINSSSDGSNYSGESLIQTNIIFNTSYAVNSSNQTRYFKARFWIQGNNTQSPRFTINLGVFKGIATIFAFGDSITQGIMASFGHDYITLISNNKGWDIQNNAVSGSQNGQYTNDSIYGTTVLDNYTSIYLVGYNDMRNYSVNVSGLRTFVGALQAAIGWLTIPEYAKINGTNQNISYYGTWNNPSVHTAKYSSIQGDYARVNVTGTTIYIAGYRVSNNGGGTFDVSINGTYYGSFNTSDFKYPAYKSTTSYAPTLYRLNGLNMSNHSVNITITSSGQNIFIDWIAGNTNFTKPKLYLGNTLSMNPTGYAFGCPNWCNGNDSAVAMYNSIIQATVNNFSSDGLNVTYVDANASYIVATDVSIDNIHPNDLGHQHIADAFLGNIITQPPPKITNYSNNYGGYNSTSITVIKSNHVIWNVTVNQTTNIVFKFNGTEEQNTTFSEFDRLFDTVGFYNITIQANNSNGQSQVVYTNVKVNDFSIGTGINLISVQRNDSNVKVYNITSVNTSNIYWSKLKEISPTENISATNQYRVLFNFYVLNGNGASCQLRKDQVPVVGASYWSNQQTWQNKSIGITGMLNTTENLSVWCVVNSESGGYAPTNDTVFNNYLNLTYENTTTAPSILPTTISNCGLNIILNNTNLAPTIEPSVPGTGDRTNATIYYTNNSAIQLMVFAHADAVGETAGVFIYINNTLVLPQSGRPLGGAEMAYRDGSILIPRYSYYRVEFINYHHYEWREYKIDLDISGCIYPSNNDSLNNVISGISSGLALLFSIIALAICLKKKKQ